MFPPRLRCLACFGASVLCAGLCWATPFAFSTGNPDGRVATATRPESTGKFEIESADDFILSSSQTTLTAATLTGLLTGGATTANIGEVRVEIYRVFPLDSDVGRTSGPPLFSTPEVPTRVNSPSDVELADRDTSPPPGNLSFTTTDLGTFGVLNTVLPGGIHPIPGQMTGGNGPATGEEVQFNITFTNPFVLPPDHYFFVPQVEVTTPSGEFLWLSAARPITGGTGPFAPDLQSWTRDQFLDPDWLRVGSDIIGTPQTGPTFNATFSLVGIAPEPGTLVLAGAGLLSIWWYRRSRNGQASERPVRARAPH